MAELPFRPLRGLLSNRRLASLGGDVMRTSQLGSLEVSLDYVNVLGVTPGDGLVVSLFGSSWQDPKGVPDGLQTAPVPSVRRGSRLRSRACDRGTVVGRPAHDCAAITSARTKARSEEHTSELQSRFDLVC